MRIILFPKERSKNMLKPRLMIDRLIDWLIDWCLVAWSIDGLIDWLIDWLFDFSIIKTKSPFKTNTNVKKIRDSIYWMKDSNNHYDQCIFPFFFIFHSDPRHDQERPVPWTVTVFTRIQVSVWLLQHYDFFDLLFLHAFHFFRSSDADIYGPERTTDTFRRPSSAHPAIAGGQIAAWNEERSDAYSMGASGTTRSVDYGRRRANQKLRSQIAPASAQLSYYSWVILPTPRRHFPGGLFVCFLCVISLSRFFLFFDKLTLERFLDHVFFLPLLGCGMILGVFVKLICEPQPDLTDITFTFMEEYVFGDRFSLHLLCATFSVFAQKLAEKKSTVKK